MAVAARLRAEAFGWPRYHAALLEAARPAVGLPIAPGSALVSPSGREFEGLVGEAAVEVVRRGRPRRRRDRMLHERADSMDELTYVYATRPDHRPGRSPSTS